MNERVLQVTLYHDTRSIHLMDKFDSKDLEGNYEFDTLEIKNLFRINCDNGWYYVSLYVQRLPYGISKQDYISDQLTFTQLKQSVLNKSFFSFDEAKIGRIKVVSEVFKYISKDNNTGKEVLILFDVPIQFNAQKSSNRTGYGNEYNGTTLVYEGTLYGETTTYLFIGAKCTNSLYLDNLNL